MKIAACIHKGYLLKDKKGTYCTQCRRYTKKKFDREALLKDLAKEGLKVPKSVIENPEEPVVILWPVEKNGETKLVRLDRNGQFHKKDGTALVSVNAELGWKEAKSNLNHILTVYGL